MGLNCGITADVPFHNSRGCGLVGVGPLCLWREGEKNKVQRDGVTARGGGVTVGGGGVRQHRLCRADGSHNHSSTTLIT